jgi:hypothetical protein
VSTRVKLIAKLVSGYQWDSVHEAEEAKTTAIEIESLYDAERDRLRDALAELYAACPTSCDDRRLNEAQRQAEALLKGEDRVSSVDRLRAALKAAPQPATWIAMFERGGYWVGKENWEAMVCWYDGKRAKALKKEK